MKHLYVESRQSRFFLEAKDITIGKLLAVAIILTKHIPLLYIHFRGLRILLPLYILWLLINMPGFNKSIRFAFHYRKNIIVPYVMLLVMLAFHVLLKNGPSWYILTASSFEALIIFSIFVCYAKDRAFFFKLLFIFVACQVIMAAVALPMLISNPRIARLASMPENYGLYDTRAIRSLGIGAYATFAGYAMTLPLILAILFRQKKLLNKIVGGTMSFFIISAISVSSLAGSMTLGYFAIALFLFLYQVGNKSARGFIRNVPNILIMMITMYLALNIFQEAETFQWAFEKAKIIISEKMQHPLTGYDASRGKLFLVSFRTFLENPIFGIGLYRSHFSIISDHLAWVDMLGMFGVIGGTLYYSMAAGCLYWSWKFYRRDQDVALSTAILTITISLCLYGLLSPIFFFPEIETFWCLSMGYLAGSTIMPVVTEK